MKINGFVMENLKKVESKLKDHGFTTKIICKFVKNFRSDLLGVCTAEVEVPCKLVEVGAHFAALSRHMFF